MATKIFMVFLWIGVCGICIPVFKKLGGSSLAFWVYVIWCLLIGAFWIFLVFGTDAFAWCW